MAWQLGAYRPQLGWFVSLFANSAPKQVLPLIFLSSLSRTRPRTIASALVFWLSSATTMVCNPCAAEDDSTEEILQTAVEARDENAEQLQTAYGSGKVLHTIEENGTETKLIDADIQVFYDKPRFRIHLSYEQFLSERTRRAALPLDQRAEPSSKWQTTDRSEQIIVYDGSRIISIEGSKDGSYRGTIYFGFAKMAVMRIAGFPFEDPVTLWTQALNLEGLDRRALSITPLVDGGFSGVLQKNTYRMKFVFFKDFGYDLRRVSSFRTGESHPFRDYVIEWADQDDIHYVKRFSNFRSTANPDTGASRATIRRLSVEYSTFTPNIELPDSVFTLQSLQLPQNTSFIDKRSNVEGGPKQLLFDGQRLLDAQTLQPYQSAPRQER
ncbi:MAG: hypothetical protein AAGG44_10495 [Planctomycetota bacterium]